MSIYLYGEDGFTLFVLKNKLEELLKKLEENDKPEDCLVFYRPSFGRGGKTKSNFGEFDAIIISTKIVYLIESKHGKFEEETLANSQKNRHKVFKWYIDNWITGQNWNEFQDTHKKALEKEIPKAGTLLAKNLEFVLDKIKSHLSTEQIDVKNILLHFSEDESKKFNDEEFKYLCFSLKDNFLEL